MKKDKDFVIVNVALDKNIETLLRVEAAHRNTSKRQLIANIVEEWLYRNRKAGFFDLILKIKEKQDEGEVKVIDINKIKEVRDIKELARELVEVCSAYYLEWNRNRINDKPSEKQLQLKMKLLQKIEELNQLAIRYGISPAPEIAKFSDEVLAQVCKNYIDVYSFDEFFGKSEKELENAVIPKFEVEMQKEIDDFENELRKMLKENRNALSLEVIEAIRDYEKTYNVKLLEDE